MFVLKAGCFLLLTWLVAGCLPNSLPKSLPNNSACLTSQQVGFSHRQRHAFRTFLGLGTPDSLHPHVVNYRQYCVSYTVSERENFGLFKVTKMGDATWPARFFIKTPRYVFLLYAGKTRLVKTYTLTQALTSRDCQLNESTKADISAYINALE